MKGSSNQRFITELKKKDLIIEQKSGDDNFKQICSRVMHSRLQTHVFHLQTKNKASLSVHEATGEYTVDIYSIVDGLIESYQGKYDIVTGYKSFPIEDYQGKDKLITYFDSLVNFIEEKRSSIKESYLQNQIDNIVQLIYSTLFKLRNLE